MPIIDEEKLLTPEELNAYHLLLKLHGFESYDFLVQVTEDQGPIDMNDINYIVILKINVIHVQNNRAHTYISQSGSGIWLSEFEDDLLNNFYLNTPL